MLKQAKWLVCAWVAACAAWAAHASPELARAWGEDAALLQAELAALEARLVAAPNTPVSLRRDLRWRLERFASGADRLAAAIDAGDGPKDLRCIFRGVSEEIGVQMDAIDAADGDARTMHAAFVRLTKAAEDSRDIAEAAALVCEANAAQASYSKPGNGGATAGSCARQAG